MPRKRKKTRAGIIEETSRALLRSVPLRLHRVPFQEPQCGLVATLCGGFHVPDRCFVPARCPEIQRAKIVGLYQGGFEFNDPRVVAYRFLVFLQVAMEGGPEVMGFRKVRPQRHRLVIVLHRCIVVTELIVNETPVRIGFGVFRVELDRGSEGIECLLGGSGVKDFERFREPVGCGHLSWLSLSLLLNSHGG